MCALSAPNETRTAASARNGTARAAKSSPWYTVDRRAHAQCCQTGCARLSIVMTGRRALCHRERPPPPGPHLTPAVIHPGDLKCAMQMERNAGIREETGAETFYSAVSRETSKHRQRKSHACKLESRLVFLIYWDSKKKSFSSCLHYKGRMLVVRPGIIVHWHSCAWYTLTARFDSALCVTTNTISKMQS